MESASYLGLLRRQWLIILYVALVGAVAGLLIGAQATPQYRATATTLFAPARAETVTELVQGATYTQNLALSYSRLATTPLILEPVIAELGLSTTPRELARRISTEAPVETGLVSVSVVAPSPEQAALIANTVTEQFPEAVAAVGPVGPDDDSPISITTVAPAVPPLSTSSPDKRLLLALGLLLGGGLGVLVALVREARDTRVRTAEDVRRFAGLPVMATVPDSQPARTPADVVSAPRAEAVRRLRVNLNAALEAGCRTFAVVSARPGEGRTSVVIELGAAFAQAGYRVLLVDGDSRRGDVTKRCELEGAPGPSSVLEGEVPLDEALRTTATGITVLPADPTAQHGSPSDSVPSGAALELLERVAGDFDVVLMDSPALSVAVDGAVLAQHADAVLLVVDSATSTQDTVSEALDALRLAGVEPMGIVLTRAPRGNAGRGSLRHRAALSRVDDAPHVVGRGPGVARVVGASSPAHRRPQGPAGSELTSPPDARART